MNKRHNHRITCGDYMWIHELKNWPQFSWDSEELATKLADIRYRQGLLLGKLESLGFELKNEASLKTLTADVLKTSAIEGEKLDVNEVRSSIARKLGLNVSGLVSSSKNVEGVVEVMLDATQNFLKPLTKDRLLDWHSALFPTARSSMEKIVVGNWRPASSGPMQVVSGRIGAEKVHFEAPHASRLDKETADFISWFENTKDIDPVIKAGISHFWFVTIHPFEDGNGRIARAIGDMALARADGTSNRYYSLSSQIEAERKDYYLQLENQQRGKLDISIWLEWFISCLGRAISNSEKSLDKVLFKAKLWEKINFQPVNERQKKIINIMLEDNFEGHINTSKYAKLAKCSNDTALRDIKELVERKVLLQNSGKGRSTSYRMVDEL